MTHLEFCYWLQGMFELADLKTLNEQQVGLIKEHLKLAFEKKTSEGYVQPTYSPFVQIQPLSQIPPSSAETIKTTITCSSVPDLSKTCTPWYEKNPPASCVDFPFVVGT